MSDLEQSADRLATHNHLFDLALELCRRTTLLESIEVADPLISEIRATEV